MDDTSDKVSAKNEIRDFIVRMSAYAKEKNVDGLMSLYHPDATSFEFASQPGLVHLSDIRHTCEQGYADVTGDFEYEFTPIQIEVGSDIAYFYGVEHIAGLSKGSGFESTVRATYCLKRVGGQWLISHHHLSISV